MKINRSKLLHLLKEVSIAASIPPRMVVLEQSDCFVFKEGKLFAFNDEIKAVATSPLDFDMVVNAKDLLQILDRLPDDRVKLELNSGELIVSGRSRSAGITVQQEVLLPYSGIPRPGQWSTLANGIKQALVQAARTCGRDLSNPLTTVVHITPKRVEACDNFRLFRFKGKTGFPKPILIPAYSLEAIENLPFEKISINKNWFHVKTENGVVLSIRCMEAEYIDLSKAIKIGKCQEVLLPKNLAQIVERAMVMTETKDMLVTVEIKEKKLTITSKKETGWYKETRRIRYAGPRICFLVHPKFLIEALARTKTVSIGKEKMRMRIDNMVFVVSLEAE